MDGFSEFANDLFSFQSQTASCHDWGLELRVPDPDGDATQTDIPASISVDFLVQCKCICNLWTAQRFSVIYRTQHSSQSNETPARIGQVMLDQLRFCREPPPVCNQAQQCTTLEAPVSQGPPTRRLLGASTSRVAQRKALEEERSVVVLGLVIGCFSFGIRRGLLNRAVADFGGQGSRARVSKIYWSPVSVLIPIRLVL